MKKVLDFLEQNVQWLALGLGVAFVLWMAYAYLIQSDHVTVTVGNEELSPGNIDRHIVTSAVEPLQLKMNNPSVPRMSPPSWVQAFQNRLAYAGEDTPAVAWTPMFPVDRLEKLEFRPEGDGPGVIGDVLVATLPSLPAPVLLDTSSGRSNVTEGPALAQGAPAPAPAPAQPGRDPNVQPVAQEALGTDKLWITVKYRIPMGEVAGAFRGVRIPLNQYNTTVLVAELWRQEMQPDGSWGPETKIAPISTVSIPPFPAENAPTRTKMEYLRWANEHPRDILQPPFYTVVAGDPWRVPGEEVQVVDQNMQGQFDATQYIDAPYDVLMKLTKEQRQMVAVARAKRDAEERRNRQPTRDRGRGRDAGDMPEGFPGGRGPGGYEGGAGPGGYAPNDRDRPTQFAQQDPDVPGGYVDPGSFEGPGREMPPWERFPGLDPGQEMRPGMQPQQQQQVNYPIPTGEFDPRNQPDPICWAHDDTVEAGKTYRYKVAYALKSPVWNTMNMTKPAELADTFALFSDKEKTEWSEPVSMEGLTKFFVVRPSFRGETAEVHIFRWHGGRWQMKKFNLAPGDAVGFPDSEIDYSTGWTLVDLRRDPRTNDPYAVLMDRAGKLHTRNIGAEANDPEYKQMQQQANVAAAALPPQPGG